MLGHHAVSIWFIIGLLLAVYGALILGAGINSLITPSGNPVVLANLHIAIWWGAGMLLLGTVFAVRSRPSKK
jgi:hypothetical protein